jgi:ribosome maturation factor RimP
MSPLEALIERTLAGMGYELADLEISNRGKMIRLFIDKRPEVLEREKAAGVEPVGWSQGGISLDDCTRVTRQLQRVLPVEGVDYDRLEVSSPGLDRKLRKEADFERFAGLQAELRLRVLTNGRRRLVGVLRGLSDGQVRIEVDGQEVAVEQSNIERARLVPEV